MNRLQEKEEETSKNQSNLTTWNQSCDNKERDSNSVYKQSNKQMYEMGKNVVNSHCLIHKTEILGNIPVKVFRAQANTD